MFVSLNVSLPISLSQNIYKHTPKYRHTHTHTHIYIYIFIYR